MPSHRAAALVAAALLALFTPACRSAAPSGATPTATPAVGSPVVDAAPAAAVRSDSAPYTDADVQFMSAMIAHHGQAIVMSRMAPSRGARPSVQTLADRIVNAQEDEIRTMQRWLRDHGKAAPEPDTASAAAAMTMAMGDMHGRDHATAMPGMLTPPQLQQLDQARGPDFDRLFLRFMIQHHRGAVTMVKQLFGSYGAAQDVTVFKLASDVSVDQTTEIARMERMLAAILFERPAP